jgi:pimeloyl-ACP methyl ester carboxylesterase
VNRCSRRPLWRLALVAALTAGAFPFVLAPSASARARATVAKAVTFSVKNVNRSENPCLTDGATYDIKGHLVGPRSALASRAKRSKRAATLYLHGLGFGEWFWNFTAVPQYNYAVAQGKAGHTSVVIDRLGYGSSGHPDGNQSCLGGQADIAHQVIAALRSGGYSVDSGRPLRFKRIVLAGHSIGSQIAMIEAASFKDVSALILTSFAFSNLPRAQLALGPTRDHCLAGGQPAGPGLPSGYAFYGQGTASDFQSIMFHGAARAVLDAALPLRAADPCGDIMSIVPSLLRQQSLVSKVRVPVLVVCGTKDALYSPLGCSTQRDRFTRSRSTTLRFVRNAGHAITLDRPAADFRHKVGRWLSKRGF